MRNGAYLFFVPFHQRPVSGWAWQRVGRVGVLGFTAGTGQKEGSLFLHDFCSWDAPVFDCLAKPQAGSSGPTCPALAGNTRGFGHTTSCHGAPAGGGTAITPTDQSQPAMFMRRKHFQIISGEKKIKKPVKIFSGFIPSLSWLSRKVFSGLWPIFYLIIKGKNIASGNGSASLSKSNILNI